MQASGSDAPKDHSPHSPHGLDVLFFCNPLLDISIDDHDKSILEKYSLQVGQACLAEDKHMTLFEEAFQKEGRLLIPGGSGLNSSRAAQYHFSKETPGKGVVGYMGAIGKDERGDEMKKEVEKSGVKAFFQVEEDHNTGACAVVVTGKERALCAHLGAAVKFHTDHLEGHWEHVDKASHIYATGFFITTNAKALKQIAEHCAEKDKPFGFNLSAVFVI